MIYAESDRKSEINFIVLRLQQHGVSGRLIDTLKRFDLDGAKDFLWQSNEEWAQEVYDEIAGLVKNRRVSRLLLKEKNFPIVG